MTIAILGATGHIGKTLTYFLAIEEKLILKCFVKDVEKMTSFSILNNISQNIEICEIEKFSSGLYDVVINCIGIGSNRIRELFSVTEYFDNLIISYLGKHSNCKYINFSSGAIYGNNFTEPAGNNETKILPNKLTLDYHTTIIKLNSELKHRAFSDYAIVDMRLFSFFSRFLDEQEHYLMADIVRAIRNHTPLITNKKEIFRDYIAPQDLVNAIHKIIKTSGKNTVMDLRSKHPISKSDLLDLCCKEFHLEISYNLETEFNSPSGEKINYYSNHHNNYYNWFPFYSSKDTILQELKHTLSS